MGVTTANVQDLRPCEIDHTRTDQSRPGAEATGSTRNGHGSARADIEGTTNRVEQSTVVDGQIIQRNTDGSGIGDITINRVQTTGVATQGDGPRIGQGFTRPHGQGGIVGNTIGIKRQGTGIYGVLIKGLRRMTVDCIADNVHYPTGLVGYGHIQLIGSI